MPLYDFLCSGCGATCEVSVSFHASRNLELVCTVCGANMHVAPILTLNVIHTDDRVNSAPATDTKTKTCGHQHHCRCHIKLSEPNPFAQEIESANRATDKSEYGD